MIPPPGVVGDSITEADSPDFDAGGIGPDSWAAQADASGAAVVGGWAHAGATTAVMLAGLDRTSTSPTDVLVLMAGNNDVDHHVSATAIEMNLRRIAARVPARRVVLSTLAPEEDWLLVDSMRAIRDADGKYLPGISRPSRQLRSCPARTARPAATSPTGSRARWSLAP